MSIKNISFIKIKKILLYLLFFELLSLVIYLHPSINNIIFLLIVFLAIVLSLKKIEYGLYTILAELFIGSKGYLFFFEYEGLKISIRIALWLIVMSIWLAKLLINYYQDKKTKINFRQSIFFSYFIILFFFVVWGLLNGLLQDNESSNIFFDFNNWLYFLLILPIYDLLQNKKQIETVLNIFAACVVWLIFKTLFLLYFFSHNFYFFFEDIYKWVRTTGVGEITQMDSGFSRIFFQSHLFTLPALFILLLILMKFLKTENEKSTFLNKNFNLLFIANCLLFSVIITSLSRSFWMGLLVGITTIVILSFFKYKISFFHIFSFASLTCLSVIIGGIIIVGIIKLPWPTPITQVNLTDIVTERATQITGEAGASSRWLLLPELWQEIKISPIIGQGFGKTVTYTSQDPRVLESSASGIYTTYAFEWGWLDIWLKLGLIGFIAYLVLLIKIITFSLKKSNNLIILIIPTTLLCLLTVNIFSPYANHPLGIGLLIFFVALTDYVSYQQKALA